MTSNWYPRFVAITQQLTQINHIINIIIAHSYSFANDTNLPGKTTFLAKRKFLVGMKSMITRKLRGGVALGSLTAAVALVAGLSSASAQGAPGAGSFPQSFLIPGTNTSIAIYGTIRMRAIANWGSIHTSDTGPSNTAGATPGIISQLPVEGPGGSSNADAHAVNGGLRVQLKSTQVFFETRTPTDLGEVKTVVMADFSFLNNQASYVTSTTQAPGSGLGNNEVARLQFAYGTLGPWLMGQYLSAWSDPLQFNPGIGDQNQVGPLQTANIRRPQIRYTYLAGNGFSLSASVESNTYTNTYGNGTTTAIPAYSVDNTDQGGITNYPSFNTGVAWNQPWGHLMSRVGVAVDQLRTDGVYKGIGARNLKKVGWAIEAGAMINTWGQDQLRGLIVYTDGAQAFLSDLGSGAYINTTTNTLDLIHELALNTSYVHRFSSHWRTTAEFGIGFFSKPANAANLSLSGKNGLEKRHLESGLSVIYSPVPGKVDIGIEWNHWARWVQSGGFGHTNIYNFNVAFFW
jgi:Porin subfamily